MANGVEGLAEASVVQSTETDTAANGNAESVENVEKESDSQKSELKMQEVSDMLSKLKLNPMAKEFFPSSYLVIGQNRDQFGPADGFYPDGFYPVNNNLFGDDMYPNYRRRRNSYNQGRRRLNGRAFRVQREESIKRTVYVSELDHNVTEEQLADLFGSKCGQVVDCRICGDPHSRLHFAFVEFADEVSAGEALSFTGTLIGFYPIKVLPSKTAILPVNPTFLPRSEDEREMCARTVYCTNIDKEITQAAVKNFFESYCGEVCRLRLLGDNVHSTRIAFVEFAAAESAIAALDCSGRLLGTQPLRVSPSKTPVRPRVSRHALP